nr:hypothetical protein [Tanacetum cinerariifolium]
RTRHRGDRPRRRQMDDDRARGADRAWRAALQPHRRARRRHQPEDADPDAAPHGARRAGDPHRPPGGAAPRRISADRPRRDAERGVLRGV